MKNSSTFRKAALAFLLAALPADLCYAIDPHRAMSQYVRQRWGTEQGFPRGPVYAISQSVDGYLYIGTETGLVRFDGLHFRLMSNHLKPVTSSGVLGLAAARDGSLWVRMRDTTLLRYRDGEFDDPFAGVKARANITATARSTSGDLLAAWLQNGVLTYRETGLEMFAPASGVPRSPVLSVAQTGDGDLWLGTRGAGLYRLRGGKTQVVPGLPDPKIDCLLRDGAKGLWIGTDSGLGRWDGSAVTTTGLPSALKSFQILALTQDRDANLWIGTDSGGLLRLNAGGLSALDPGKSEERAVTAVFEDREGNLWTGSADGIERLRDSPFVTYSDPEGLPTDGSNPVFVDAENRTWFPPSDGGLLWFRDGERGRVAADGLDRDIVYSIAGGPHELWLGRQRGGLTRLALDGGRFAAKTYSTADGLAQNSVYAAYIDHAGVVWAGTLSGGVSKLDHGVFTTYTSAQGLAANTVASMLQTAAGTMWFATPNGLSSLAEGRWRTFSTADGLPSENVNCLFEDSSRVLWVGTTAGLAYREAGRFAIPVNAPAPLREQILGIAEDRSGALWVATAHHVLRVSHAGKLLHGLDDGDVTEYGLADGLRGVEGVKRHQSLLEDSLGRIWISLNRGISVVDPARLKNRSAPAIAHIETLSADGAAYGTRSPRIPAGRQRFVFNYAGLSLSLPERVRFRYKLEGSDHEWSGPVAEREAGYTNLGPGDYHFRLAASNPDGIWNPEEAVLDFQVDPAYWQTWWFRTALVLAGILGAVALYRLRMGQLTSRLNDRFEERFAERTRIAQELHDTLLQGFLSVSMQVQAAENRLPAGSPVKPALERALEVMTQVIDEGRDAVRGLRSSVDASQDLESAFVRVRDELLIGQPAGAPEFRVVMDGRAAPLDPVLRGEIYRIGREAIINAFRHARANRIDVELTYSASEFKLCVRDDGCGMDPRTVDAGRDGHWGLSGMRERADQIGGRLRLGHRAGGGTEVELSIPGRIAFAGQAKGAKRNQAAG